MKRFIIGSLVFLLAGILVACGDDDKKEAEQPTSPSVEISNEEKVDDDKVVAVINGEDVTGRTYNLVYTQLKLYAGQFGEEVEMGELKQATIDSIIDRQLVMQQAKEEGIEITDEIAESEFETIKSENKEALETLLEQYQITEEGFKDQLKFEMTMNEYQAKVIKVSVTDDELKEYYEKAKEGNEDIPEFDEIKDTLKKQVLKQKTDEELEAKIEKAREESEIEEKI
ncbi:SurA N-terminal domain-containing protein [Pseudogracilibacillus sp. SE30717A]|uniref:SurA N-terminal domain-containing protein n=1 Tax=Pseudogracilibacillus sp. SE30717A TaxID=3098293 RepID=UPI00300E0179